MQVMASHTCHMPMILAPIGKLTLTATEDLTVTDRCICMRADMQMPHAVKGTGTHISIDGVNLPQSSAWFLQHVK